VKSVGKCIRLVIARREDFKLPRMSRIITIYQDTLQTLAKF